MFVFIIPRTPLKYRNKFRDELWQLTKQSLMKQTSSNWKAIIVGDTNEEILDNKYFQALAFDEYSKAEKIEKALDFIEKAFEKKPEYLIRLDDDDIFSSTILDDLEKNQVKFDCCFDEFHHYLDSVYLNMSRRKNFWIANTAIHKYEHAIAYCGPKNIQLLVQDHSEYWHKYYSNKKVYLTKRSDPLYYRILNPFSITSQRGSESGEVAWNNYLSYLKGYGPWKPISNNFWFFGTLAKIAHSFFMRKPRVSLMNRLLNKIRIVKQSLIA